MTDSASHSDRTANLILLDLYGSLLTDRTREVLDLYLAEDLSLTEIAENLQISRQGVHDTITRGLAALHDFESRLELMRRRQQARQVLDRAAEAVRTGDMQIAASQLMALSELL